MLIGTILLVGLIVSSLVWGYRWHLSNWDGRSRFTVVQAGKSVVTVKSFDPVTGRGVEITLPKDLEIETISGRGRYLVQSLTQAGSADWVAQSVGHYLGIFVLGEISHMSVVDQVRFWWAASKMQWQKLDLVKAGLVEYDQTADNLTVGHLSAKWNLASRELFTSLVVAQEELAVKVVNTTSVAGLAAEAARAIESAGISVVEVTADPILIDKCLLTGQAQLEKKVGVQILKRQFDCQWQAGSELRLNLGSNYRKSITGD